MRFHESAREVDGEGFGLVEVIIAMFVLALVVIGMLPALIQGIGQSARQSSVAFATRYLNSIVEEARDAQDCTLITSLVTPSPSAPKKLDARKVEYEVAGSVSGCAKGQTASVHVQVSANGRALASTTALIYVP